MRRAVFLLLLLAVGSCLAAEVPVSTAQELLSALSFAASPEGAADTTVQLQVDIALNQEAAASFDLPFVIPSNHTLTLEGAGAGMKVINFGLIVGLLFFQPDSTLVISHLNVTGHADPQLTAWPEDVGMSPTSIQRMPMWPTVWAEPGFTMRFNNSHLSAFPTDLCTPENFGTRLTTLQQLATAAGAPYDVTSAPNSTFANFNDLESSAAVLDSETQSTIGEVSLTWKNSTLSCSKPDGTWGAALPSDSSSSGGTPAWVWAVVGTVAALAVAAVAGGLLWRRRRKRIRQQQEQKLEVPDMEGGQSSDKLSGQASLASAKLSSMGKAQSLQPELSLNGSGDRKLSLATGGSSMMDQLTSSRSGVPEGAWKSRVGFIEGLQLGNLIGRGGYARVYNGRWKGTTVAVKVVETHVGPQQRYDLRDEPLLTLSLSHPNVLQGYKMCAVKVLTDGETERVTQEQCAAELTSSSAGNSNGSQGPSLSNSGGRLVPHLTNPNCMVQVMPADAVLEPGMYEMWLLSELADKGTLSDAMKAGWLSQAAPPGRNMPVILLCLLDVARGLEYLHSCSIVHGDLKPQNVLLKTSGSDRRGYVCKLGDFGLSRMLGEAQTHVDTGSYGTVTHAAPELLSEGRLTKASDVFAFGMLLWELVTGERLFSDMHHMQIIVQVTQHGYRPPLPADFPPQLANLVQRCWSTDASLRPDAESVVQELITFNSTLIVPSPSTATTADGRSVGNLQGLVPAAAANSSLNVAPLGSTAISPFAAAAARHP